MPRNRFRTPRRRKTDGRIDGASPTRENRGKTAHGTRLALLHAQARTCEDTMSEAHRPDERNARERAPARAQALAMRLFLFAVGFLTAPFAAAQASPLDEAATRAIELVRALPQPDGARLEVEALPFDARVSVVPCTRDLVAELVGKRLAGARASVRVRCTDPQNPWSVAVALRVSLYAQVLVAKRALVRGDVVDAGTTELAERDVLALGYGHIEDPARYLGSKVTRPVQEGAALPPSAIAEPLLVERGGTVTLLARGPAIDVRAAGVALEDGAAGARVRVKNTSSGRTVDGVVDGPGVVAIGR
jgi:flagella basal body P-ring formation protein FlgA